MKNAYTTLMFLVLAFTVTAQADTQFSWFDMKSITQKWSKDLNSCPTSGQMRPEDLNKIRLDVCSRAYQDDPRAVDPKTKASPWSNDLAREVSKEFYPMFDQCVRPNLKARCVELDKEADLIGSGLEGELHTRFKVAEKKATDTTQVDLLFLDNAYKPGETNCEARMILDCLNVMVNRRLSAIAINGGKDTRHRLNPAFETSGDAWVGDYPAKSAADQLLPPDGFHDMNGLPPFLQNKSVPGAQ
jgi:hypothetical protein